MADLNVFEAGKGINANKLNENFDLCKIDANANEAELVQIATDSLKKDGSNLTQEVIDAFNQTDANEIIGNGVITLDDNSVNFITLEANSEILLPVVPSDNLSHTIVAVIAGGSFSLNLGTSKYLVQNLLLDISQPYSVLYVYNKLDNSWYYCLTQ